MLLSLVEFNCNDCMAKIDVLLAILSQGHLLVTLPVAALAIIAIVIFISKEILIKTQYVEIYTSYTPGHLKSLLYVFFNHPLCLFFFL